MDKSKSEAEAGVKLVGHAKESLYKIVNASERCLDQVNSIAAATEEQSAAVEEVSSNVEGIVDSFTNTNDAVSQINSSIIDLSKISNELVNLVA